MYCLDPALPNRLCMKGELRKKDYKRADEVNTETVLKQGGCRRLREVVFNRHYHSFIELI